MEILTYYGLILSVILYMLFSYLLKSHALQDKYNPAERDFLEHNVYGYLFISILIPMSIISFIVY
jgi:hypothetical protein